MRDLERVPVCCATPSVGGNPSHTLPIKLRAIAEAGFRYAELAWMDLEAYAGQEEPGYQKIDVAGQGDIEKLVTAAAKIKALCDELKIEIIVAHVLSQFEGYTDPVKRAESFGRAAAWWKVLKALDCQILQVGTNDDLSSSSDLNVIASDLRELSDEAAAQKPPISIAYEPWCWGAHVNTWEGIWDVCKRVDRPNFGLCLDVWHICARVYHNPDARGPEDFFPLKTSEVPSQLKRSLDNLTKTFSDPAAREKIIYFQLTDASGPGKVDLESVFKTAKEKGIHPFYAYSPVWRPLPFMDEIDPDGDVDGRPYGGFLPFMEVIEAVMKTGWRGLCSYEVFYGGTAIDNPKVPKKWANAAMESYRRITSVLEKVDD